MWVLNAFPAKVVQHQVLQVVPLWVTTQQYPFSHPIMYCVSTQ
jgi:hypothetical protein